MDTELEKAIIDYETTNSSDREMIRKGRTLEKALAHTKDVRLLSKYASSNTHFVLRGICSNPRVTGDILLKVLSNKNGNPFVAFNSKNFPLEVIEEILFNNGGVYVENEAMWRATIYAIEHRALNDDRLLHYAKTIITEDEFKDKLVFLEFIFKNPNITLKTFEFVMTHSPIDKSRMWLAELIKKTSDLELLQFAVNHSLIDFRLSLNRRLTSDMLDFMLADPANENDYYHFISNHLNLSPQALAKLSLDNDAWTRKNVALHKNTSSQTLIYLSEDEDSGVRANIAKNKRTPKEVLENLLEDKSLPVRRNASKNLSE